LGLSERVDLTNWSTQFHAVAIVWNFESDKELESDADWITRGHFEHGAAPQIRLAMVWRRYSATPPPFSVGRLKAAPGTAVALMMML
jgi:hypothetical protein